MSAALPLDVWLGETPDGRLENLYSEVGAWLEKIQPTQPDQSLRELFEFDRQPRVRFDTFWRQCEVTKINRRAQMISGPLFTSYRHPWPVRAHGGYCEPMIQLDLEFLSQKVGFSLGSGLLQLWMDGLDGLVRVVPRQEVVTAQVTPVDENVRVYFAHRSNHAGNAYRDWPNDHSVAPWLQTPFSFRGLSAPVHEVPAQLEFGLNDIENGEFSDLISDPSIAEIASCHLKALMALDSRYLRSLRRSIRSLRTTENGPQPVISLFGKFRQVQWGPAEGPLGAELVLADIGENDFFWFNYGNAQIYTDLEKPGERFWFDWSAS